MRTDQLLSVSDVAAQLNVSRRLVQRLITAGALPAVRVGPKLWRVDPAELRAWQSSGGSAR